MANKTSDKTQQSTPAKPPEPKLVEKERDASLRTLVVESDKAFGKGSLVLLGTHSNETFRVTPSGSLSLDAALGIGGYPEGRIVEIYGPESSGKTTLTLHAIANAQAQGKVAAFIDAEHAFDARYARAIGVDTDRLLVSQPDSGEQGLGIAEWLARSGNVDFIVIDSVAALVPRGRSGRMQSGPRPARSASASARAQRRRTGSS
jgi:recombination protein RecA